MIKFLKKSILKKKFMKWIINNLLMGLWAIQASNENKTELQLNVHVHVYVNSLIDI